jgi:hypothetical protein
MDIMADKDDDLLDRVTDMADRLELTGSERRSYIHEHMTRSGYKAVPQYVKGDSDDDDDNGSPFFGGSRRRSSRDDDDDDDRSRRRTRRNSQSRRRRSDDWYDDE